MLLTDVMLEKPTLEVAAAVSNTTASTMTASTMTVPSGLQTQEARPPVYSSDELLQGNREAWIEHGQQMYRLRLTHAGKLYLTK